ncbi:MAG: Gfo/Idh/MocA family oxidoreductase [Chitinophagales bacterium]|nr:Gfo/Idh/MocA family oxidoreductase [Bacteroidota bacterium]
MIKIGIIGLGRMGIRHFEKLMESPYFEVVGCYDIEPEKLQRLEEDYTVHCFDDVDELISKCDAVDILTPANAHYFYAEKAIKQSKHVFLNQPLSNNLEDAKKLVELVRESGVKLQVGHIERFNPAFLALQQLEVQPMFIESQRWNNFHVKRTSESVVLDEMLHDIDIVLSIVKANIKSISASGVSVVSNQIDVANARIEFDNGCVANLTASRTAVQKMRKMQLFQKDNQITIDFLNRETTVLKLSEKENQPHSLKDEKEKQIKTENLILEEYDALKEELNSFAECLIFNTEPRVSVMDALKNLEIASEILQKIYKINSPDFSENEVELLKLAE